MRDGDLLYDIIERYCKVVNEFFDVFELEGLERSYRPMHT